MKKKLVLLLIGIFSTLSINAQKTQSLLSCKFSEGCPAEIEKIAKQLGLTNLSQTNLETGIDSIKVVLVKSPQGLQNGYCISSYINNKLSTFQTIELIKSESSPNPTNIIDIKYNNGSNKLSVLLTDNTANDEIQYVWIDNNNDKTKFAAIIKLENKLEESKLFPSLTVQSLKGDKISIKDFVGKYVVINWWATNCAPCRKEIPGLNTLVKKYKSNSDVIFLAIAFDEQETLENFLSSRSFEYSQTLGDINASKLFGESFPKNIIVNPQGIISYYSLGGNEDKHIEIDNALKSLLTKK